MQPFLLDAYILLCLPQILNHPSLTPLPDTTAVSLLDPHSLPFSQVRKHRGMSQLSGICDRLNSFLFWDMGEIVTALFVIRAQGPWR